MKPALTRTLIALGALLLIGIGAFAYAAWRNNAGTGEASPAASTTIFENASSSFGERATSTESEPPPPAIWSTTWIRAKSVGFTPPPGTWVFESELRGDFSLVPGNAPVPGSPDPSDAVQNSRIASMISVERDAQSFPTWERFRLTMAQFQCASGTTEEDLVICLDTPKNVITGKTEAGLPFIKFSLEAVRKLDQAPRGLRTFVMVRLGESNDSGILITVLDERNGGAPALQLAKSMRIQERAKTE